MALTPTTWRLKTYTANQFTDLAVATGAPLVIKSVILASTLGAATVSMRTTNSAGVEQTVVVNSENLEAGASYTLDMGVLVLGVGEKLQVSASDPGVHFTASGVQ